MLTTIKGKTYGFFNRFKPEYPKMEKLIELCENSTSREVLEQIKTSCFDNTLLNSPFLIRENSPMPVHPMRHQFTAACQRHNYPVVRLLLELGMDVDVPWNYHEHKTHRQIHSDDSMLMELFEGGKCWWKIEYPEAKKQELRSKLGHHILNGNASEAAWLMTHGVQLDSPNVLASESVGKQPMAFKELVCRMGIPDDQLNEFHDWLKENRSDAGIQDILETMLYGRHDEEHEIAEKLLLSINLLSEDKLDALAVRTFPIPARISLLKGLIETYDSSEHQSFIEKYIAELFREILCICWEV